MKPSQLISTLTAMTGIAQPIIVWGPPGVCKSSAVHQVAKQTNRPLIDVRTVLLDPVDLRGLPHVNGDGRAHWAPPSFLPYEPDSRALLFLDELGQAPPLVQAACLQLTLDRRLGDYVLPKDVVIVAASNRQEDRAGANRMITPLLNRFLHLSVEVSAEDWQAWAVQHAIDARVRSFLAMRPALLLDFDPKKQVLAFPTPRSWEFVSRCLPATTVHNRLAVVQGCVGEGAAAEFVGFCELADQLPDIGQVLANPGAGTVPTQPSVLYALAGALVERYRSDPNVGDALAKYALRMPPEFGVMTVRDAATVNRALLQTPGGQDWVKANQSAILAGTFKL